MRGIAEHGNAADQVPRGPEVHATLAQMGQRCTAVLTAMLTELGIGNPQHDARAVIAVCAGIVYESTVSARDPYTVPEIAVILRDLLTDACDHRKAPGFRSW